MKHELKSIRGTAGVVSPVALILLCGQVPNFMHSVFVFMNPTANQGSQSTERKNVLKCVVNFRLNAGAYIVNCSQIVSTGGVSNNGLALAHSL
jgi:hypothetical protein